MIISLGDKKTAIARKTTWKQDFRAELYKKNKETIQKHSTSRRDRTLKQAK